MAKASKILCERCGSKLVAGSSSCARCGYPTRWASHQERTRWEVSQWKTAERAQPGGGEAPAPPTGASRRRVLPRPFQRRTIPEPDWHLSLIPTPSTQAAGRAAAAPKPVPQPVAKPVAAKPVQQPAPQKTISLDPKPPIPALKVTPQAGDADAARDTPGTVIAMRLLNARVAELHDRIQRLERELAEARPERSHNI